MAVFGQRYRSREIHPPPANQVFGQIQFDPFWISVRYAGTRQDTNAITGNLNTSLLPVEARRMKSMGKERTGQISPKLTLHREVTHRHVIRFGFSVTKVFISLPTKAPHRVVFAESNVRRKVSSRIN